MNKQQFFSFVIYDIIKKGATDFELKYHGGVIMLTWVIDGVRKAETVKKTDSHTVHNRYATWFKSIIATQC